MPSDLVFKSTQFLKDLISLSVTLWHQWANQVIDADGRVLQLIF
jgi:hypothetical protein